MIIAIDTGGTKTLVASLDENGVVTYSTKFPTPPKTRDWVLAIKKLLEDNWRASDIDAIVIGVPGIVKNGVAIWCNNLGWHDFDIAAAFHGVANNAPILIENDANLAGLAETRSLDTTPVSSLYVTISTGIGTGFITNGYIDPGLAQSEGGRSLVEYDGKVREWESFASGKAIASVYGKFARDIESRHTWNEIADRISRGFLALIPIVQPDIIIIGGSIGTYFERYGDALKTILKEQLPSHIPCPKIIQAKHPEQAVIYGGYYYAKDFLNHR